MSWQKITTLALSVTVTGAIGVGLYFYSGIFNGYKSPMLYGKNDHNPVSTYKKFRTKEKFLGRKQPKYLQQTSSLNAEEKQNMPFSEVENTNGEIEEKFSVAKEDIIFADNLQLDQDGNITWKCIAEVTKGTVTKSEESICKFFIDKTPTIQNFCYVLVNDLTYLSFKYLSRRVELPPKLFITVFEDKKKDDSFSQLTFLSREEVFTPKKYKKITLKKNDKEYLSIGETALNKSENCFLDEENYNNYYLVKANTEGNYEKSTEKLFKKGIRGFETKNYVCKTDFLIKKISNNQTSRRHDRDCEIYELENVKENITNLSQYISGLSSLKKAKEELKNGKFYILKMKKWIIPQKNILSSENDLSIDKTDAKETLTSDNSHIRIYDVNNKKGETQKTHGRFQLVANINVSYDDEEKETKSYVPEWDYPKQLFIVKATNNNIQENSINNLKCFEKSKKSAWPNINKNLEQKCKIYKFEKDLVDIKDLSFEKPATQIKDPKTEIKNNHYYIFEVDTDWLEWRGFTFNYLNYPKSFSLGKDIENEKVDFKEEISFFGDYTKPLSETNSFFLFTGDTDKK